MQVFTAKQLHDNPSEVYRAAVKGPVKVTHKHHGDFKISAYSESEQSIDEIIEKFADDNPTLFGKGSNGNPDDLAEFAKLAKLNTADCSELTERLNKMIKGA